MEIHVSNCLTRVFGTRVKLLDTCISILVSNWTRVLKYTCQNVQLVSCTSDTRKTRVKILVANILTRVQCRTRVKMHVAICHNFCSDVGVQQMVDNSLLIIVSTNNFFRTYSKISVTHVSPETCLYRAYLQVESLPIGVHGM